MKVSGKKYSAVDEKFDRKRKKKEDKSMKTAGISNALKDSKRSYSKLPSLKAQKKGK